MIHVLLADDHTILRHGLKRLLEDDPDIETVIEACDGNEVVSCIRSNAVDVVVLDITMPKKNGLDVLKDIKSFRPDLPVLVLSMHPEEQYAVRMIRAGAAGYLTKERAAAELIRGVKVVACGKRYITQNVAEYLAEHISPAESRLPHQLLSDREYQVMQLIASGHTPTRISQELCLSIKTVSTYRTRLLEKLGVHSSAEITRYALQNQLVD